MYLSFKRTVFLKIGLKCQRHWNQVKAQTVCIGSLHLATDTQWNAKKLHLAIQRDYLPSVQHTYISRQEFIIHFPSGQLPWVQLDGIPHLGSAERQRFLEQNLCLLGEVEWMNSGKNLPAEGFQLHWKDSQENYGPWGPTILEQKHNEGE